jgi:hypothetical protein
MKTKINRPDRNDNPHTTQQEWYDLGYSDAQEDELDKDSDAYDTGYDDGLADGRKELSKRSSTTGTNLQDVKLYRLEERVTKVERQLRKQNDSTS